MILEWNFAVEIFCCVATLCGDDGFPDRCDLLLADENVWLRLGLIKCL